MTRGFVPIALVALAGCGGGKTSSTITYATVTVSPQSFALDNVERNEQTGDIVVELSNLDEPIVFSPVPDIDVGSFQGHASGTDEAVYFRKSTGTATVGLYASIDQADVIRGTFTQRWGETTAPTTGEASWSGDYLGIMIDLTDGTVSSGITGLATVVANFDDQLIAGGITDRILADSADNLPLLALLAEPIDEFGGATGLVKVDGQLIRGPISNYNVVIAGESAESAVGQIYIDHSISERELGVFLAEQ